MEAQEYPGVFAIVDCEFIIYSNAGIYPSSPPAPTAQHSIIEVKVVTNNSLVEGKIENKKHWLHNEGMRGSMEQDFPAVIGMA